MNLDAASTRARTTRLLAFAFTAIVTFLTFSPALLNGFVLTWDDGSDIVRNEQIRSISAEMLRWAFFDFHVNFWAPLTWISFALDHAIWGLEPFGFHLTNNILHSVNAGLFFLLCQRLLEGRFATPEPAAEAPPRRLGDPALIASVLAALLFSLHPLRAESVAWVTERKDVLSLFFGLLSVLAYLAHARMASAPTSAPPVKWAFLRSRPYWLSALLFCLALLSKPTLVTLPVALLVLDAYPLRRLTRSTLPSLVLEKSPLLAISGGVTATVMAAHSRIVMPLSESGLSSRVVIAFRSIVEYLRLTFWPVNLSPFYLHPGNVDPGTLEYLLPVAAVGVATLCFAAWARTRPVLLTCWAIYLITLLPALGATQVSNTFMADRFTYLPTLSVALLVALALTSFVQRVAASRWTRAVALSSVVALLVACAGLTARQVTFWKDDVALWSRAIDVRPHFSGRTYSQRATAYELQGDFQSAVADMDEAITIALGRKYTRMQDLYLKRARLQSQAGRPREAVEDYGRALALEGSRMRAYYLQARGELYRQLGMEALATRDFEEAAALAAQSSSAGAAH